MEIFVKATNDVCYVGTADDSNGSNTSWTVEMQLADLPEGCQPTPTPQQAECCDDTDFSIDITVDTGGSMTDEINGVTLPVIVDGSLGKLCWKEFGEVSSNASPEIFDCPIANSDGSVPDGWANGGMQFQVRGIIDDTNRIIKFEHSSGKCYQATLISGQGNTPFVEVV